MTQEKKLWLNQTISVIENFLSENVISDAGTSFKPSTFRDMSDDEKDRVLDLLFDDTCAFVNLRHELSEFKNTLKNMIKYSEMCEKG